MKYQGSKGFKQKYSSAGRGRIRFMVDTWQGPKERIGRLASQNFAASFSKDWPHGWYLTHLGTGAMIPGSHKPTFFDCRALAQKLEYTARWNNLRRVTKAQIAQAKQILGIAP